MDTTFFEYWYFFIPNYALALLVYTLLGRLLLSFFVPANWDNYIWRAFRGLTDWIVDGVGYITPRALHGLVLLLIAAMWLHLARVLLTLVMSNLGWLPDVGPAPAGTTAG